MVKNIKSVLKNHINKHIKSKKYIKHIFFLIVIKLFFGLFLFLNWLFDRGFGLSKNLFVNFDILNSFTPNIEFFDGNIYHSGDLIYTNDVNIKLKISSISGVSYILTGDINMVSGEFLSNSDFFIQNVDIIDGDGKKQISGKFTKVWDSGTLVENVNSNVFDFYYDSSGPTQPVTSLINTGDGFDNILFEWSSSVDTGVGFLEYTFAIAKDSNFVDIIYANNIVNNYIYIDKSILGTGNFYWLVTAEDKLGNITNSDISFFVLLGDDTIEDIHAVPKQVSAGNRYYTFAFDVCPNGDKSPSYYDGKCDNYLYDLVHNSANNYNINNIVNLDKMLLYTNELMSAYEYAYSIGATTQSLENSDLLGPLIRRDLAKMISQYAIKVVDKKPDYSQNCVYNDIDDQTDEMKHFILLSCFLGLMGLEYDGKPAQSFNPNLIVTRAQFATVFSRLLFGNQFNGNSKNWYQDHLDALSDAKIMNIVSIPEMKELRGYVMIMMQRADGNGRLQ